LYEQRDFTGKNASQRSKRAGMKVLPRSLRQGTGIFHFCVHEPSPDIQGPLVHYNHPRKERNKGASVTFLLEKKRIQNSTFLYIEA